MKNTSIRRRFVQYTSAFTAAAMMTTVPAFASTVPVHAGDSIWKIAVANHTTVAALEASNPGVTPNNLTVGTNLQLPARYIVQSGDSMWTIAKAHSMSVNTLMAANPSVHPWSLTPGMVLNLPTHSSSTPPVVHAATVQSTTSVSGTDIYWLSRLIHAEAEAEPYQAQVAVGDVVYHRTKVPGYGSTIKSVIFQIANGHYQFTCVANGFIYNTPTQENVNAAKAVLESHQDIVPGALVFYNPSMTPAGSWVRTQPVITQIGALTFAK